MQQDFQYLDGSFSKAAEHLYLTQPALSIAIQKIENSIGMPLFDRSRRPLQLTAAGEAYIQSIQKIQSLEYDLNQQIRDIQNLNTGLIRFGGSHYVNAYILSPVLTGFCQEYPGIKLEITEESSDVLSALLTQRKIDLTFSCNPDMMKKFEHYSMFRDHILLAVPENHPVNQKAACAALTAQDIIDGRHLDPTCPSAPLSLFSDLEFIQIFQEAGFHPNIKLRLSQLATAYHLAADGFAATLVSDRLIHTPNVPLRFYQLNSQLADRMFYVLLPNRNYTSFAVKRFIQYLLLHL